MRRLVIGGLLVALAAGDPALGRAQDWSVTRMHPAPRSERPAGRRRTRQGRRPHRDTARAGRDRSAILIERYKAVLRSDPRETFAFQRLLDLYRERDGNVEGLLTDLERARREHPDDWVSAMLLGHLEKARGHLDRARAAYQDAVRLRPNAAAAHLALGRALRAEGRLPEARAELEQALERTPEGADAEELARELGQVALEQGDFEGARGYYARNARGAAGSVYLLTEYARALQERGEHARAIEEYQRVARTLRGDNRVLPPVLRDLGRAQLDAGHVDDAIATLDRALRLAGRSSGIRREILDVLVEAYRRGDRLLELAGRLEHDGRRDFDTRELLGRLYDEAGDEERALAAYRAALRINPRSVETRVRVVQLLSRSGRIDDVIAEYRTLVRVAPREPRFLVELARLLAQVGRRDEAERLAAQAGRRHPREAGVHQALAELYAGWGDQERMLREMEILVRIDPRDPSHLVALGAEQLEQGRPEAARLTWQRIVAASADPAEGHAALAAVYADHDMLDDAEAEYRLALRADPSRLSAVRGLAALLERPRRGESARARHERDDEAVRQWMRVLELAGSDRLARREARGRIVAIWSRRRALRQRMAEWKRAFEAEPPDVEAGRFLAEAQLRGHPRDLAGAEHTLEAIIGLEPGDVESLLALERTRTVAGDLEGAIAALELLVDADPHRAPMYLQRMAEHAHTLYRDEDAVRYAARAVEYTPSDASGHRRLGDLYRARQDLEDAIASYRRAIALDDRLYSTYFDLAEVHVARGELDEADALYRQVMRSCPDDDLVVRATRASMQIRLGQGTLEGLEVDLLPLALGQPGRPVYRRLLIELYDAITGPLIEAVDYGGGEAEAAEAELRRLGNRAIKPLLEALSDPDPTQRRVAVDILGYLGNPNAAGPLLAAAEGGQDLDLRARAVAAAGAVARASLAPRFVAIATGRERRLRPMATWALARMAAPSTVGPLRALLGDGEPGVRAYAALGLGRIGDRASIDALEAAARRDRSPEVAACAAWALGALADPRAIGTLRALLASGPRDVASVAASSLGRLDDPAARAGLVEALFAPEPARREAAARALAVGGRPAGAAFPMPAGRAAPGDYVARLSAQVDGPVGPVELESLRESLVRAARDSLRGPVEGVRAALEVLCGGGSGRSLDLAPVTRGIQRWPVEAREAAQLQLRALGQALVPDIVHGAGHPDPGVREVAVACLGRVEGPGVARALRVAVDDPEARVRRAALRAVGADALGPELAERVAHVARSDRDWTTRLEATRALGRLRGEGAEVALAEVLGGDDYAFVREEAARALRATTSPEARAALERARRDDPEPRVRRAAEAALVGRSAPAD